MQWSYVLGHGPRFPLLQSPAAGVQDHVSTLPTFTSLEQTPEHQ
jgi:hypothetical protein